MGTPVEPNAGQGNNAPGPNPAWNDVLSVIPEELHTQVTPYFQQWDQSAQQRIEQVNSQLANFEQYKPFVEHGIAADELERGLQLIYQINTNPQEVYQALAEAYNLGQQGNNQNSGNGNQPVEPVEPAIDLSNNPAYQQLQNGLELVSQIVLQDQQAKQQAAADSALEQELAALREKHKDSGGFDEEYVLSLMDRGRSADDAVAAYQALVSRIAPQPQQPNLPSILSSSGTAGGSGYPSRAIDPTKLSSKETRSLVQQMIEAANLGNS